MGAMRDRVPGARAGAGHGVEVEVGEKQTAIDLEMVVQCTARRASPTSVRLLGQAEARLGRRLGGLGGDGDDEEHGLVGRW
jgi:hypothetical protein